MVRRAVLAGLFILLSSLLSSCQSDPEVHIDTTPSAEQSPEGSQDLPPESSDDVAYMPPSPLGDFIKQSAESVVMIACGKKFGTGWFIDTASPPYVRQGREGALEGKNLGLLVTVDHLTNECAKNPKRKLRAFIGDEEVPAQLVNWNTKVDIALLSIDAQAEGLPVAKRPPQAAWVIAIGFPLYFGSPVTLVGSVIHSQGDDVVAQMPSQPGNSGSPLINSQGEVVATLKEAFKDPDKDAPAGWSLGNSTQVLCRYLFKCTELPITQRRD